MKSVPSKPVKVAIYFITMGLCLLVASGVVLAQPSTQDMFKGAVKEGAKEVLGINKPVQGQAEMMDGAKMMMEGRHTLREHLLKNGKLKQEEGLPGGKMMTDGHEAMVDGDRLIRADKTAEGKKKMLDGEKMMIDAKQKMLEELSRKGLIGKGAPSEGERMMNDGEKIMKKAEMTMLK